MRRAVRRICHRRGFLLFLVRKARHFVLAHDQMLVDEVLIGLIHITATLITLFLKDSLDILRLVAQQFLRQKNIKFKFAKQ